MIRPQTLILATRNQGKVRELRTPLARFGFDVQSLPDDFPEVAPWPMRCSFRPWPTIPA